MKPQQLGGGNLLSKGKGQGFEGPWLLVFYLVFRFFYYYYYYNIREQESKETIQRITRILAIGSWEGDNYSLFYGQPMQSDAWI